MSGVRNEAVKVAGADWEQVRLTDSWARAFGGGTGRRSRDDDDIGPGALGELAE